MGHLGSEAVLLRQLSEGSSDTIHGGGSLTGTLWLPKAQLDTKSRYPTIIDIRDRKNSYFEFLEKNYNSMFTQAPLANSFAYFVILKSDDGKQIHIEDCKVPELVVVELWFIIKCRFSSFECLCRLR